MDFYFMECISQRVGANVGKVQEETSIETEETWATDFGHWGEARSSSKEFIVTNLIFYFSDIRLRSSNRLLFIYTSSVYFIFSL